MKKTMAVFLLTSFLKIALAQSYYYTLYCPNENRMGAQCNDNSIVSSIGPDACSDRGGLRYYLCDEIFNKSCDLNCPPSSMIGTECADGSFDPTNTLVSCRDHGGVRCYYCYKTQTISPFNPKKTTLNKEYKVFNIQGAQIKKTPRPGVYIKKTNGEYWGVFKIISATN